MMAEDRRCLLCGDPDGYYLDAAKLCRRCAPEADITLEHSPCRTAIVLADRAGRRAELLYTAVLSPDLAYWQSRAEGYAARAAAIADGSAEIDDPAFVERLDDYFAQTEDYGTLVAVSARTRDRLARRAGVPARP